MTSTTTDSSGPVKVAVIGGGCASMAAAFELTRPEHRGRYQVTVYQVGWRLGGKGASGRGPSDRIEEHGLHLWMGFYENAFRMMRECYAEADRDPRTCRIVDWRDAFQPDYANAVADRTPTGAWLPWKVSFPALPGLPGDPNRPRGWTVADYVGRTLLLLRTLLQSIQVRIGDLSSAPRSPEGGKGSATPSDVSESIARLLKLGELATFGGLLEALRLMQVAVAAFSNYPTGLVLSLHEAVEGAVRRRLDGLLAGDDELRRLWTIVDICLAVVRGALRFQLLTDPRGFDAVDDYECREWLRLNGASQSSVSGAATRALYDLVFAYEDGDVRRPRISAAAGIRGTFRAFFTYRGSFFWKMQAGMGDVVFAPLWEVLKKRGVRFEFFHRLTNVRLADGVSGVRPHVSELELDVQARIVGDAEYRPLVDVRGLPCWPSQPDWAQLVDGEALRDAGVDFESHWDARCVAKKSLRVGDDFDLVVLGVGLGAVPHVCREIVERDARWRDMVTHVKTVPTQALQLWMREEMSGLGWNEGPVNISGFVEPFDTWADMSHLVGEESHTTQVRSIAYFCSVLSDGSADEMSRPSFPGLRHAEVKANAVRFLERDIVHLWPAAADSRGFRWQVLVGPAADERGAHGATVGDAKLDGQYWRANVNPSDRYALSLPGSAKYRISPLDHTYDNLTIAGDWTECGLNQGCVEAAVMSGMLAAHAISRSPALSDIVGYDQP